MKTPDILIVHPKTSEQVSALKAFMQALKIRFEVSKDKPYNPEFVAKINKSKQDVKEGRYTDVDPENLKEFIEGL